MVNWCSQKGLFYAKTVVVSEGYEGKRTKKNRSSRNLLLTSTLLQPLQVIMRRFARANSPSCEPGLENRCARSSNGKPFTGAIILSLSGYTHTNLNAKDNACKMIKNFDRV